MRNSKIIPAFLFMVMFFAGSLANAQDSLSKHAKDTLRLGQAFQKGKVSGQFRYFFMATDNRDSLSDYYAHAAGARLKYETAPFRKFQVGIAGGFVYNLSSSDLAKPDPTTHQYNRYEIGLFDVEDPANKKDIDRVEELYLKYKNEKLSLSFGKQIINTPFINPQDGRMQPTAVEGLYGQWQPAPALKIDGGWLYAMSPRSTGRWFSIGETMGLYPQGLNPDGSKSNYASNVSSAGIGLLGLEYKPINQLQLKAWNVFTENVSNTMLLEAAWQQPLDGSGLLAAVQYMRQDAVNDGGNADRNKTYFHDNKVNSWGARLGWSQRNFQATLNYNRITKSGRFTMPREWGIEPLFTFLSRERLEGAGDADAVMLNMKKAFPEARLKTELGYGHYYLPALTHAALNKYAMPSYSHLKLYADYDISPKIKGLNIAALFISKQELTDQPLTQKNVFNKVEMLLYNIILNYRF